MKAKIFLSFLALLSAAVLRSSAITYGVSAGNSAGISDYSDGGEAPELPDDENEDALENGDAHYWARLRQPRIQRADRITASSIEIEWKCEQVLFVPEAQPQIVIMRQTHDGDWNQVHSEAFQTSGTWTDTGAAIGPTYRYSAYTSVSVPDSPQTVAHTSDADDPVLVEYHPVNLVLVGYRGTTDPIVRTPPGGAVNGGDPKKTDIHSFSVLPLNPHVPAFITPETTSSTPTFSVANITRYWDEEERPTSFAVNGHIVHGKAFPINARVLVGHGEYGGIMLEINGSTPAILHGGYELKGRGGEPNYFCDYRGGFHRHYSSHLAV